MIINFGKNENRVYCKMNGVYQTSRKKAGLNPTTLSLNYRHLQNDHGYEELVKDLCIVGVDFSLVPCSNNFAAP